MDGNNESSIRDSKGYEYREKGGVDGGKEVDCEGAKGDGGGGRKGDRKRGRN